MTTTIADRLCEGPALCLQTLELAVSDEAVSRLFYARYFGFGMRPSRRSDSGTLVLLGAEGFGLALVEVAELPPGRPLTRIGFQAFVPEDVEALRSRLVADGVEIVRYVDEEDRVAVRCLDPDGYQVEMAWSAPLRRSAADSAELAASA
jgi:catechol 2,3-dioxygenase-like lactoylglutathione lyase family enzyme